MINFNDVESGLHSARLIMVKYLIQVLNISSDKQIIFNDKAYDFVFGNSNGNIVFMKPQNIVFMKPQRMYIDPEDAGKYIVILNDGKENTEILLNDMSADDLYSLCEMVHDIARNITIESASDTVDIDENDFEFIN